jgi:hypothetical protein
MPDHKKENDQQRIVQKDEYVDPGPGCLFGHLVSCEL